MAINPYSLISRASELSGDRDLQRAARDAARGYADAQKLRAPKVSSLPMTAPWRRGSASSTARRSGSPRPGPSPTPPAPGRPPQPLLPPLPDHPFGPLHSEEDAFGYQETTVIQFDYVQYLTLGDKNAIEQAAQAVPRYARRMSRGRLPTKRLRQMNHPYGYGTHTPKGRKRRKLPKGLATGNMRAVGITNMSIVNKQSGNFERSWLMKVRYGQNKIAFTLRNDTPHAKYLARGTKDKHGNGLMKAHSPFGGVAWGHYVRGNSIRRTDNKIKEVLMKRGRQAQIRAFAAGAAT